MKIPHGHVPGAREQFSRYDQGSPELQPVGKPAPYERLEQNIEYHGNRLDKRRLGYAHAEVRAQIDGQEGIEYSPAKHGQCLKR